MMQQSPPAQRVHLGNNLEDAKETGEAEKAQEEGTGAGQGAVV